MKAAGVIKQNSRADCDIEDSNFLRVCRGEAPTRTPLWLMRQAGRYLPEYREIRKDHSMLELCQTPELVAEVTHIPLRRYDFDAAILFSDITMPFIGFGIDFSIESGVGPVVAEPIRREEDLLRLHGYQPEENLGFIGEAIKLINDRIEVPLIGFAGAPFTLAAYLVEGRPSREFKETRILMHSDPGTWHTLMEILTDATIGYLNFQAKSGVHALQIFDSWVGGLSPMAYREFIAPHMARLVQGIKPAGVPLIHFGVGTALLLEDMKFKEIDVLGVDWKTPISWAREQLGSEITLQGNLDPTVLFGSHKLIAREVDRILLEADDLSRFIFNLGHGILPGTPVENVAFLVDCVHNRSVELFAEAAPR